MKHPAYKDSLGIFGIDQLGFLSDRMWAVMDRDKLDSITLEQYLSYFDVMLHGSKEEKMKQSFDLLDEKMNGTINLEDFNKIVQSFAQMWSAALGYPIPLNLNYIKRVFQQFAGDKDYFDFENFKTQMELHPDLLAWFSKPEEAMNKRLYTQLDDTHTKKRVMLQKVDTMKIECSKYFDEIERKLQQCLKIFDDDQSFEDIKSQIQQFLTDVQEDTSLRTTGFDLRKKKTNFMELGEYQSKKSNVSRVSSYDRNSLIDYSYNHSPKHLGQRKMELGSELFTGKIDLTKQNGIDFDIQFPLNLNTSNIQQTKPNTTRKQRNTLVINNQTPPVKNQIIQKSKTGFRDDSLSRSKKQFRGGVYQKKESFDIIKEEDKAMDSVTPDKYGSRQNLSALQPIENNRHQYDDSDSPSLEWKDQIDQSHEFQFHDEMRQKKKLTTATANQGDSGSTGAIIISRGADRFQPNDHINQQDQRWDQYIPRMSLQQVQVKHGATKQANNQMIQVKRVSGQDKGQIVGSPSVLSDNESLVRDKSINLNDVDVQLEGGDQSGTGNLAGLDRHKSITLNISPNQNHQEMEFEDKNSQDQNNIQRVNSRRKYQINLQGINNSFLSSEGENIDMNEYNSDDEGNLKLKMEKSKNITYLKSHQQYEGQFYYMDGEIMQERNANNNQHIIQIQDSDKRAIEPKLDLNNDNPFKVNSTLNKQTPVLQSGYFGENPHLLSFGSKKDLNEDVSMGHHSARQSAIHQEGKIDNPMMSSIFALIQDINKYIEQYKNKPSANQFDLGASGEQQIGSNSQTHGGRFDTPQFTGLKQQSYLIENNLNSTSKGPINLKTEKTYQKATNNKSVFSQMRKLNLKQNVDDPMEEDIDVVEVEDNRNQIDKIVLNNDQKMASCNKFNSDQTQSIIQPSKIINRNSVATDNPLELNEQKLSLNEASRTYGFQSEGENELKIGRKVPLVKTHQTPQVGKKAPHVIVDETTYTSPNKIEDIDDRMQSNKNTIQISFGKMFIKHMIEKIDGFKEMLATEIEEIMKKGDYYGDDKTNLNNNEFPGGMKIRVLKKKKNDQTTHQQQNTQKDQNCPISKDNVHDNNDEDVSNKYRVTRNIPKIQNQQRGLLKDRQANVGFLDKMIADKRPSKANRSKEKQHEDEENAYSQMAIIHPAHENFNMVLNIMLGIKKAVDSTLDIPLLQPTDKDFHLKCNYQIAPYRTDAGDMVKACTFWDYAPQIFAAIRKSSGIKKQTYSQSLGPEHIFGYFFNANFKTLRELCSSGKSGSFFYYTSDGNFMLKTIRKDEFKLMKRILRKYYDFLTRENPDSMISRIYGLHKVIFYRKKHKMAKKLYFCIMNNVFNTNNKIDYRFDLKGSTQGRRTTFTPDKPIDNTIALKDLDFLDRNEKFKVAGEHKEQLLKIIHKDANFFKECGIIDYSMLVGVHEVNRHKNDIESPSNNSQSFISDFDMPQNSTRGSNYNLMLGNTYGADSIMPKINKKFYEMSQGGLASIDKSKIYYLGIIDIFTEYNMKKKGEHFLKSIQHDSETISCVPPDQYAQRFYEFIKDAIQ